MHLEIPLFTNLLIPEYAHVKEVMRSPIRTWRGKPESKATQCHLSDTLRPAKNPRCGNAPVSVPPIRSQPALGTPFPLSALPEPQSIRAKSKSRESKCLDQTPY